MRTGPCSPYRKRAKSTNTPLAVPIHSVPTDLEVLPPSVNQSTVTTFAPFFLSVPVHNNGDAAAVWRPKMVYYRSTDDLIGTSDTKVGEQQVGGVFAGTTNTYTIQLNAPSTTGTYYYGACVEPSVTYESNVANNCSVEGVQVVVN